MQIKVFKRKTRDAGGLGLNADFYLEKDKFYSFIRSLLIRKYIISIINRYVI